MLLGSLPALGLVEGSRRPFPAIQSRAAVANDKRRIEILAMARHACVGPVLTGVLVSRWDLESSDLERFRVGCSLMATRVTRR